jgi:DNA ligase-1
LLRHRLMGGFQPDAEAYRQLLAEAEDPAAVPSRPYPFCLASPLERVAAGPAPLPGDPQDWLVEWKWDGIRAQLIRRAGQTFLWSRGEELIQDAFPEVSEAAGALPEGTVLDGELLVWPQGAERPAPFGQLQRRLGRRRPGRAILRECPVRLLAYDLLERDGSDLRSEPLSRRRSSLEALLHTITPAAATPGAGVLGLSPRLACGAWRQLEELRQGAVAVGAEGLMLKALDSPYRAGRRRGCWWKHKRDPWRLDAVLLYAQAGRGRRANLFTDYTFALWDRPVAGQAGGAEAGASAEPASTEPASAEPARERRLVSFAKAYSGLDDQEILRLDRWIRSHTIERFGPVRAVQPLLVFELAFEGLQRSGRHQSGIAVRFPRISRWRHDKPASEADCLNDALALLAAAEGME